MYSEPYFTGKNVRLDWPEKRSGRQSVSGKSVGKVTDWVVGETAGMDAIGTRSYNVSGRTSPVLRQSQSSYVSVASEFSQLQSALETTAAQLEDTQVENELLRNKVAALTKERDAAMYENRKLKAKTDSLRREMEELKGMRSAGWDIAPPPPSPLLLAKAQSYSDFIHQHLPEFPSFHSLFLSRAGDSSTFPAMLKAHDHFGALLVCLQVLSDLIVLQTEDAAVREAMAEIDYEESVVARAEDEYKRMMDQGKKLKKNIGHQGQRIAALGMRVTRTLGTRTEEKAGWRTVKRRNDTAARDIL